MYELLGICLAFTALFALNATVSLLSGLLWRALKPLVRHHSAAIRADMLFALRVLPSASATICVLALIVPAYITHEPQVTREVVTLKLGLITGLSALGLGLAAWRGFMTWRATRRLIADWLSYAEPIELEDISIPAYRLDHRFPIVAVVGTFRPRLFIADQVIDSLSPEEIQAVVAHESGHLAAHDNLKRTLMRACRDVLTIVPCGRSLDRDWTASSEEAADEYAARRCGSLGALNLADAMIKIARAVKINVKPTMPAGAFLIDETGGDVASRVRRLTQTTVTYSAYGRGDALLSGLFKWAFPSATLLLLAFIVTDPDILRWTHMAIEQAMRLLQ